MDANNHHIIELRKVEKSFGSQKVLDKIDLAIETGQTTVAKGPGIRVSFLLACKGLQRYF